MCRDWGRHLARHGGPMDAAWERRWRQLARNQWPLARWWPQWRTNWCWEGLLLHWHQGRWGGRADGRCCHRTWAHGQWGPRGTNTGRHAGRRARWRSSILCRTGDINGYIACCWLLLQCCWGRGQALRQRLCRGGRQIGQRCRRQRWMLLQCWLGPFRQGRSGSGCGSGWCQPGSENGARRRRARTERGTRGRWTGPEVSVKRPHRSGRHRGNILRRGIRRWLRVAHWANVVSIGSGRPQRRTTTSQHTTYQRTSPGAQSSTHD